MARPSAVAGLLLTGGASRRLGQDKATLLLDGERLCDRAARLLSAVADPVIEVGPQRTALDAVREDPPGQGPLTAMAAGAAALPAGTPAIVLAVDMPRVTVDLLRALAEHPADGCVVPVAGGHRQTLCARYSVDALMAAPQLVAQGARAMAALLDVVPVTELPFDADLFADIDTPDDLRALT